ncbi:mevalonate kinase [Ignicoccus islandicus DSM 13165]|uniref:Mevalonate kinase n=1 Tax=Ignicoccus islandicus DSM 13165 TaxID=940295 RepID=A0A0U3FJI5_9CREN|nr:mevalonate kinase [Ignicoccus islandicus]ALU12038.1 mevalonate kinase [Ignicoccus islandicus DSM 13165]
MIVSARAPTKVTLFGEHAVVYGYPAIVLSIPEYVVVEGVRSDKFLLRSGPVYLNKLSIIIGENAIHVARDTESDLVRYFSYVLEAVRSLGLNGLEISIKSRLPVGAGLGTSAAVTVGTVAVASKIAEMNLTKKEIAKIAWEVEKKVQGKASPMDTFASALGGALYISKAGSDWNIRRLSVENLPLVIGVFRKRKTTGELVKMVNEKLKEIKVIERVLETIGEITNEALKALENKDLALLGELMNINHGLLEALGLTNKEVACAIHSLKQAGALGAKMSGAGYGGAVIALGDDLDSLVSVMRSCGAEKVLKITSLSNGVEY